MSANKAKCPILIFGLCEINFGSVAKNSVNRAWKCFQRSSEREVVSTIRNGALSLSVTYMVVTQVHDGALSWSVTFI